MRKTIWLSWLLVLGVFCLIVEASNKLNPQPPGNRVYVCPPCGCNLHDRTFDKLGVCPACGMPLVRKINSARKSNDAEVAVELKTFLDGLVQDDEFSGTVLLAKNGKVFFSGAYGLASKNYGVANRLDTKFNLGSMNKMFTAVAIAQLAEQGKLSFDDPLARFLPSALPKVPI